MHALLCLKWQDKEVPIALLHSKADLELITCSFLLTSETQFWKQREAQAYILSTQKYHYRQWSLLPKKVDRISAL